MKPAGSGSLPILLFLSLNLVVLSSYALPLHGTSAGTGFGRLKRHFRTSQPVRRTGAISSGSIHAHLHQRRKQAPMLASSRRSDGPMSHQVHLIDRAYLPANMTDVKHVILARRHRHKDYQTYEKDDEGDDEDSKSSKSKSGKDDKGYDDGSWSEDKYDEEETSTYSKKGKSKYKAASSDTGDAEADSTTTNDTTSDTSDLVESDDTEVTEDSAPATKAKTVSKSKGDDTADEEDKTGDSKDSKMSDQDDVEEDDTVAKVPDMKNKSVKSSKEDDTEADPDEEDGSSNNTSTKSARSASTGDCATLKKVYDDMGGSAWKQSKGWTKGSDNGCCEAYGVSCNSDGQVTALDLGSNGLNGTISPAIFDLKSLTKLNLTDNSISGSLPDKFDLLPHLNILYMDQNSLSGEIPSTLQNSSSLWSLHISNNTFDGMLYFPNAYNLSQIYASKNAFTYINIDANTALQKVVLDDNQFNCTLPNAQNFHELLTFSAARNKFTGEPFDVTDTTKLTKLDLSRNALTGSFPDVTKLPSLTYLGLQGNTLSGHFPTGSAPASLETCYLDPILTTDCPSESVMSDSSSLASRCGLKCRGGGKPVNAVKQTSSEGEGGAGQKVQKASSRKGSAAGQEGRTVNGDDTGMTPASLAAAVTSDARRLLSGSECLHTWPVGLMLLSSLFILV